MKEHIRSLLAQALAALRDEGDLALDPLPEIPVERSRGDGHGDFASPVALALGRGPGRVGAEAGGGTGPRPRRKLNAKQRAELLRRQVDTVGRLGQPGGGIRNVISVGMLSEGWDAKTVTHIMGLRACSRGPFVNEKRRLP